jgi:hypothetical protein
VARNTVKAVIHLMDDLAFLKNEIASSKKQFDQLRQQRPEITLHGKKIIKRQELEEMKRQEYLENQARKQQLRVRWH